MTDSYVAVDLETTGLNPKRDKIIEIGGVRVINGKVEEVFETLVNPYRRMEEQIVNLTGITDSMLAEAPGIETVLKPFLTFAGELPLLGHHIIFDYSFLKRAAVNQKLAFERKGIDTLTLCRQFMPGEEKKNLKAACFYFNVEQTKAHRALADADSVHRLYQQMKLRFGEENAETFLVKNLIYQVKREQPASKRQKEHLQDLLKYHKIGLTVQLDHLSRNEISRMTDKIISQYGRI